VSELHLVLVVLLLLAPELHLILVVLLHLVLLLLAL
jgi:hypothetical protein